MLTLRYGTESTQASSLIMLAYTLMLSATSSGAYASVFVVLFGWERWLSILVDRKSTRLNSSHVAISYAVFCLKKINKDKTNVSVYIANADSKANMTALEHVT